MYVLMIKHTYPSSRSTEVLSAAAALRAEAEQRSRSIDTIAPLRAGKKGPSGRMDYRASDHPVMCIGKR